MKTIITIISLSTILVCLAAWAQTQQRATAGGLAERFKQLDRNGDGKISREEAGSAPRFERLDRNNDGVLDAAELESLRQGAGARNAPNPAPRPQSSTSAAHVSADGFVPEEIRMDDPNHAYVDIEFAHGHNLAAYYSQGGSIWVADMDPDTGLFKTPTGQDYLIQENAYISGNGPEWGISKSGPAVFYSAKGPNGTDQIWRARPKPTFATPLREQVSFHPGTHLRGMLVSQAPELPSVRVWAYQPLYQSFAGGVWFDETDGRKIHPLEFKSIVGRFVTGSGLLVCATEGKQQQIKLLDTTTGKERIVTNDGGSKSDPWMWFAPEFGYQLTAVAGLEDDMALGIYRDTGHPSGYWQRVATLKMPASSPHRKIFSAEPIAGGRGLGGVSYFTVQAYNGPTITLDDLLKGRRIEDSSVWVIGLGNDPNNRFARRVDRGALDGAKANRHDPESFIGENELFVYCTLKGVNPVSTVRCRTGIMVQRDKSGTLAVHIRPEGPRVTSGATSKPPPASISTRSAATPPSEAQIEANFPYLDRNGDGKLDASEAGERPFFKPADKNGDGVLTLDEVKAYFGSRQSGRSPAAPNPQPTEKP